VGADWGLEAGVRLKFDFEIEKASTAGDNDLAMEMVRNQRDWYEYFGYGTREEIYEYWARKAETP
jgi:hypothetical protein